MLCTDVVQTAEQRQCARARLLALVDLDGGAIVRGRSDYDAAAHPHDLLDHVAAGRYVRRTPLLLCLEGIVLVDDVHDVLETLAEVNHRLGRGEAEDLLPASRLVREGEQQRRLDVRQRRSRHGDAVRQVDDTAPKAHEMTHHGREQMRLMDNTHAGGESATTHVHGAGQLIISCLGLI